MRKRPAHPQKGSQPWSTERHWPGHRWVSDGLIKALRRSEGKTGFHPMQFLNQQFTMQGHVIKRASATTTHTHRHTHTHTHTHTHRHTHTHTQPMHWSSIPCGARWETSRQAGVHACRTRTINRIGSISSNHGWQQGGLLASFKPSIYRWEIVASWSHSFDLPVWRSGFPRETTQPWHH